MHTTPIHPSTTHMTMLVTIYVFPLPNIHEWTASFPIYAEGESTWSMTFMHLCLLFSTLSPSLLFFLLLVLLCSGAAATSVTRLPWGARHHATYTCNCFHASMDCSHSVQYKQYNVMLSTMQTTHPQKQCYL